MGAWLPPVSTLWYPRWCITIYGYITWVPPLCWNFLFPNKLADKEGRLSSFNESRGSKSRRCRSFRPVSLFRRYFSHLLFNLFGSFHPVQWLYDSYLTVSNIRFATLFISSPGGIWSRFFPGLVSLYRRSLALTTPPIKLGIFNHFGSLVST